MPRYHPVYDLNLTPREEAGRLGLDYDAMLEEYDVEGARRALNLKSRNSIYQAVNNGRLAPTYRNFGGEDHMFILRDDLISWAFHRPAGRLPILGDGSKPTHWRPPPRDQIQRRFDRGMPASGIPYKPDDERDPRGRPRRPIVPTQV